jgi:hypothetical protein
MAVTDMAELPRLAAGTYVLFLFYKSQAASASRKPVFSDRPPGRIFATPGRVDVGERICRKADNLGDPNGQANDQAMMSGVI